MRFSLESGREILKIAAGLPFDSFTLYFHKSHFFPVGRGESFQESWQWKIRTGLKYIRVGDYAGAWFVLSENGNSPAKEQRVRLWDFHGARLSDGEPDPNKLACGRVVVGDGPRQDVTDPNQLVPIDALPGVFGLWIPGPGAILPNSPVKAESKTG